jgi:uncharacterized protein YggE
MQVVLDALGRLAIALEDIQTAGPNVGPVFDKPGTPEGGPPQPTGYRASNMVIVTLRDLGRVDGLLDALIAAGITNLGGLQFGLRDMTALHARALEDAVRQARPLAEAAARAVGLTVGDVDSIEEVSEVLPGPKAGGLGVGAAAAVAPGTITVDVRVKVSFRVRS